MSIVQRNYAPVGPTDSMLDRFVSANPAHIAINLTLPQVSIIIDVENTVPDLITTLDEYMATHGFIPTTQAVAGALINVQRLVGANGTYIPTPGARRARLRMTGAGGGGGAAQAGALGTASFGAGGGSGTYLEKWIDPGALITGGAWTGSATGGAGGTGGVGNGADGADATIIIQGVTYTAKGGLGGGGMATSSSPASTTYAWRSVDTSGPSDLLSAMPGAVSFRYDNGKGFSGAGGSNPMGYGGAVDSGAPTHGGDARGYGGGGGGALAWDTGSGDKDGGDGSPTLIIIDEYL